MAARMKRYLAFIGSRCYSIKGRCWVSKQANERSGTNNMRNKGCNKSKTAFGLGVVGFGQCVGTLTHMA